MFSSYQNTLEIFNLLSANAHNLVGSKILNFSTLKALADKNLNVPETVEFDLTHYQMTNFRLFQTERVCRRQFQI